MATDKITINFDEDDLTLGDMEDFETVVGQTLLEAIRPHPVMGADGRPERDEDGRPISEVNVTAKALKALVWITLRRDNPEFTLDDARNIKVGALNLGGDVEDAEGNDTPSVEAETSV